MSWIITGTQRYQPAALLDQFPGAAAAYSLRNLVGTSSPAVVRVRRDNDDAEQDFTAAEVSDGTLAAWVGAGNDGFVRTWYDQSGNDQHAIQSTSDNQPKIVDSSGGLVTVNGEAALDFDGANDDFTFLTLTSFSAITVYAVLNVPSSNTALNAQESGIDDIRLSNNAIIFDDGAFTSLTFDNPTAAQALYYFMHNESVLKGNTNGATEKSVNDSFNFSAMNDGVLRLGIRTAFTGSNEFSGTSQEIIVYPSDQSANRAAIEANINAHYSIYP